MDIMIVINDVHIIHNVQHLDRSSQYITLLIEDNIEIPGFSRLKLLTEVDHQNLYTTPECFVETINGIYLSSILFVRKFIEVTINFKQYAHGPCLSDKNETCDMALCFHLHSWPKQAEQWIYRHRPSQWPSAILINIIINYGCILVPIGHKEIQNS